MRIMVVDDDEDIRAMIALVLEDGGYTVLTAAHGGEALRLLDDPDNVAVIMLDYRMPEVSAPEFMEHFLAQPPHKQTAIVILYTAAADVSRLARELGLSRYLAKPAKIAAILRSVADALEESQREAEAGRDAPPSS